MRDKTQQIIEAALRVFLKRGYSQATTQEIAREAEVAEVTLFRKFSTKQNLFFSVIKPVIERQFHARVTKLAKIEDTSEFFRQILEDRLEILSKNAPIIKMLIAESIMNNLEEEVNLPAIIFNSLKQGIEIHFERKQQTIDAEQCARLLAGILASHIIWPNEKSFHQMEQTEKDRLVDRYLHVLQPLINEKEQRNQA